MAELLSAAWLADAQTAVNGDENFSRVASEFDATVVFGVDGEDVAARFAGGELVAVVDDPTYESWDVALRAPRETWTRMLAETPPPLHNDLVGAWLQADLTLEGDLELAIRHLRPLKRLHAIFREVAA